MCSAVFCSFQYYLVLEIKQSICYFFSSIEFLTLKVFIDMVDDLYSFYMYIQKNHLLIDQEYWSDTELFTLETILFAVLQPRCSSKTSSVDSIRFNIFTFLFVLCQFKTGWVRVNKRVIDEHSAYKIAFCRWKKIAYLIYFKFLVWSRFEKCCYLYKCIIVPKFSSF